MGERRRPVAGEDLAQRRAVADHRARLESERGIQRYRTFALAAGVGQAAFYQPDRVWVMWATVAFLALTCAVVHRLLSRDPGPARLVRLGGAAMAADSLVVVLFMANALRDPSDPIQMLPLFVAAEGAVRWGRNGGLAVGAVAGVVAAAWSVAVHVRHDIDLPLTSVSFRVIVVLIIGSLLGSTVSAVRRQRRLADMVCNASSDLIVSFDLDGVVRSVNPASEAILGYTPDEIIGQDRGSLMAADERPDGPPDAELFRRMGSRHVERRFIHKEGHAVWLELDLQPDLAEGLVYAIGRDVSERRETEAELRHRADHDSLTGAANRAHLIGRLVRELPLEGRVHLLFIDLDDFKEVNDGHGHRAGDDVLVEAVRRMRAVTREVDLVARLAGDEFCVLLTAPASESEARDAAQRIGHVLAQPFDVDGDQVWVTASVGSAASVTDDRPADLLDRADLAMYEAKRSREAARADDRERSTASPSLPRDR